MTNAPGSKKGSRAALFSGILPLEPGQIPKDVVAGITLATLAIPTVMGYTSIAGMPVVTGLYAILIPIAAFAVFGSSRHLVVSADSATATIMYAALIAIATPGSEQWVALAGWLAIITAVYLVLARLLKLGFLADFLSRTVLVGFLTGVGVQIACAQVAVMIGVDKSDHGYIVQAITALARLAHANPATLVVSGAVVLLLVGGPLISRRLPWALIAVVGSIVASRWLDLAARGVATMGTVPGGLPRIAIPALPSAVELPVLLVTSLSMLLVILAQSAATSRAYATKYDDPFSENTDLVGLSIANVAAGLTGTFVVNGSPTQTQMVDDAGGKTQISQLTTAAVVVLVLLFLTRPLEYMPSAVLASVVFVTGVKLVDVNGMRKILVARPLEFWIAFITAAVVVVVGVGTGIFLAIALSLLAHVRHSYHPHNVIVGYDAGRPHFHQVGDPVQAMPGLLVYHFGASLYYANAQAFQEQALDLVDSATPPVKWFALESFGIGDIDYSATQTLCKLIGLLKEREVRFVMVDVVDAVREELVTSEIVERMGSDAIYDTLPDLLDAYANEGAIAT